MRTRLVALLTFCLALLGCEQRPIERMRVCAGHLRIVLDNGMSNLGTAFVIGPRVVITADHVRIHEGSYRRVDKIVLDGHELTVLGTESFGKDGLLLHVAPVPEHLRILEVGPVEPRRTDVLVPGYASAHGLPSYRLMDGHILSDRAISILIEPGMSGSPVIDAEDGHVMGVVSSYYPNLGVTEFTPIDLD